jgi:hypothetical protein
METKIMNTLKASTLRPGLLVNLKTSKRGNVKYDRQIIERTKITAAGEEKEKWQTERTITDPEENELASRVQSKAGSIVRSVCATSAFGLLCPEADAEELNKAIAEARALCQAFNDEAKLTRVSVYVMVGKIAADDVEAVRAINSEVRDLMDKMTEGMRNLNIAAIREAASAATKITPMLTGDAQVRAESAIKIARDVARQIKKAGTQAAQEIDRGAIRKIIEQRTAFLDVDDATEIASPVERGVAVDLNDDDATPVLKAAPSSSSQLELD